MARPPLALRVFIRQLIRQLVFGALITCSAIAQENEPPSPWDVNEFDAGPNSDMLPPPPSEDLAGASISWRKIPQATEYEVKLYSDPELKNLVFTEKIQAPATGSPQAFADGLDVGQYFAVAEGFKVDPIKNTRTSVGTTKPFAVVAAQSLVITGSRYGLPAPKPLAPTSSEMIPPGKRIAFRWTKVAKADRYRFRLWRVSGSTGVAGSDKPQELWVTETKYNWLDVTDVPPGSYRYLGPGQYRWHIASVTGPTDVTPIVGDEKISFFEVSDNAYLKRADGLVEFKYSLGAYSYDGFPSSNRQEFSATGLVHRVSVDFEKHFGFNWGFHMGAGLRLLSGDELAQSTSLLDGDVSVLFRRFLSDSRYGTGFSGGWTARLSGGLGFREVLQANTNTEVFRPLTYGGLFDAGFAKAFNPDWGLQFGLQYYLPLVITTFRDDDQSLGSANFTPLNGRVYIDFMHYIGNAVRVGIGAFGGYERFKYEELAGETSSTLRTAGLNLSAGFQF